MSTPMFVDPEISTQADGAQSSRVPVPLPEDPYEAIRQSYLDGTDTKSEPFEDHIKTETPDSPHTVAPPTSLPEGTPPTLVSILRRTTVWQRPSFKEALSGVSEDAEDEGPTVEDEDPATGDESLATVDEDPGMGVESHGSDDESRGLDDEGYSIESDGLAVSEPLGLRYGALRRQELAVKEDHVYNNFEVGQGYGYVPEPERPARVSASRQPTLTTWTDLEDDIVYIDVSAYPPPTPPTQTPPSHELSSGSLPISLTPSIVPSPILSPMIPLIVPSPVATPATAETEGFLTELEAQVEMQRGLIRDHTVRLEELSPDLFKRYDRDIGELFTRSRAVKDQIFSQRYQFRSLEHEQERVTVTFGALWRPMLALESWAGQMDA
ncbi:hypothetical protein Tco_0525102 [Tanacetum coccineum]